LQDQFLTVPTDAMRNGDFSGSTIQLVDPKTGLPFANNQIPKGAMDPSALALLQYIPTANVPGVAVSNFRNSATTLSTSNSLSVRFNENLTPNLPTPGQGRGGAAGGRGGGGGGRGGGGAGGAGGRGGRGLTINLSAQLQYRGNSGEQFNVVPGLGGNTTGSSLTAPISLTVAKGRVNNSFQVNFARTRNSVTNPFSNTTDVGDQAGIDYPTAQDPLNWGVPNLTFSNFGIRLGAANLRTDTRITTTFTQSRQRQRPRRVYVHRFVLRRRRAGFPHHGRRFRRLSARHAAAGHDTGRRSHVIAGQFVRRLSRGQLAEESQDDLQPRHPL
jgi:hypothetical protein